MRSALDRFREIERVDPLAAPPTAITTPADSTRPVDRMPVADFAQSGRVIRIYSAVLDCEVILAADNAPELPPGVDHPIVYRATEFRHLRGITPEGLQLIHAVKEKLGGDLVDK